MIPPGRGEPPGRREGGGDTPGDPSKERGKGQTSGRREVEIPPRTGDTPPSKEEKRKRHLWILLQEAEREGTPTQERGETPWKTPRKEGRRRGHPLKGEREGTHKSPRRKEGTGSNP